MIANRPGKLIRIDFSEKFLLSHPWMGSTGKETRPLARKLPVEVLAARIEFAFYCATETAFLGRTYANFLFPVGRLKSFAN